MTQTTTDYLLQLTAPAADRPFSTASSNDDAGAFDDHLSQASGPSNEARGIGSSNSRTDEPRPYHSPPDRDVYPEDRQSAPSSSASSDQSRNAISSTTPPSATSNAEEPVENETTDDVDRDEHDSDKPDIVNDAALGGPATSDSRQADAKTAVGAHAKTQIAEKAKSLGKVKATDSGAHDAATDVNAQAATARQQLAESNVLPVALTTNAVAGEAPGPVVPGNGAAETVDEAETTNKASADKRSRARGKSSPDASDVVVDTNGDEPATPTTTVEEVLAALPPQSQEAEGEIKLASKRSVRNSSDADLATDNNDAGGKNSEGRADVAAQTNKLDATQLANGAPNASVAASSNSSKNRNESSAKPVGPKSDPAAAALERLTRTSAGAGRSGSATESSEGPRIDPSRFVARVAKAFHTAQDRGGTLQLRLSPPELGALRLELTVKDGAMSAALQTETASARRLLLDHLPALRDRLAEQNIRVDRFDVDVRRDGSESQADARGSRQQHFQHHSEQPTPRRPSATQPQPREVVQPQPRAVVPSVGDNGLNLIV